MAKALKLAKPVYEALQKGWPLHWECYGDEYHVDLIAVTWTYENGTYRTKHLWGTYDQEAALAVDRVLRARGGTVDGSLRMLLESLAERHEALSGRYPTRLGVR